MFAWGEDYRNGFRLKKGQNASSADGVQLLNLSFHITDLSVGLRLLSFIKANGEVSIIHTREDAEGRRTRGKQKYVDCKEKINAVCCGDDEVTLLSETGTVFCVDTTKTPYIPRCPEILCKIQIAQIACGKLHTLALTKGGQLYTWGQNSRGQLGLDTKNSGGEQSGSPQLLRSLSAFPVVHIAAGGEHSVVVCVSGTVFAWGRNDCGQLGLGDTEDRHTPVLLHHLNMKKTVHVSCGEQHTVFLTKDGVVFTCGSGSHGQLGHNHTQNEVRPQLVAELWGAKVTKTACGRFHTLVMTDSMKVYSFGCDDQGQLGRGVEAPPSVPLHVQIPQGQLIKNIFAGGDSSFATCPLTKELSGSISDFQPLEKMIDRWNSACQSKTWKETKQEILRKFSSASFINRSFLDHRQEKHFQTSTNFSGLDLSLAHTVFHTLVLNDCLLAEVEGGVMEMLSSLGKTPMGVEALRIFPILTELLSVMQQKRKESTKLAEKTAAAVQKLTAENRQTLGNWWLSLLPSTMKKHVKVWKTSMLDLTSLTPTRRRSVRNILLILQNMYNVNGKKKIPEKSFHCEINQRILQEDLQLWRSQLNNQKQDVKESPLVLFSFTSLMDLKSKVFVFDCDATLRQKEHQTLMVDLGWLPVPNSPYFELKLRRASLLEDTLVQLSDAQESDFRKHLVVYLDGDMKITWVYKKDFFHHLFHNFLSSKPEMFMLNDSKTLAWFSSKTTEDNRKNFYILGLLCGLAPYNATIMHFPFPLVLFKKLLNVEPSLEDMLEFSPAEGSLQYIVNYKDDDFEIQDIDSEIIWDQTTIELDPQNPRKLITSQNKKEFVDAYINHAFNTSVEKVFQEFKRGFFQLCDRNLLKLFQPEDLRELLVGQDAYDWAKLKQNTRYALAFYDQHPTVQMFWEVFDELTEDKKKDFLWFITGFRTAPVLGLSEMRMIIQNKLGLSGSHDQHFPESLTCHCILELPIYSTKNILRDRLLEALNPESAFF